MTPRRHSDACSPGLCWYLSKVQSSSALPIPENLRISLLMFSCILSLLSNKQKEVNSLTKSIWAVIVWAEHNREPPPAWSNAKLRAASGGFLENFHFRCRKTVCAKATITKNIKKYAQPQGFYFLIGDRFFQKEIPVLQSQPPSTFNTIGLHIKKKNSCFSNKIKHLCF